MSDQLSKVLESFCRLEGVQSAMLLLPSGDVAGTHSERTSVPLEQLQAISSHCLGLGNTVAGSLQRERVTHSYLEFGEFSVVAEVIDTRATLVIVTDPDTNLGRLRLEIRKNRKIIDTLPL